MIYETGWIEPQLRARDDDTQNVPLFSDVGTMVDELPEKAYLYDLELKVLGELLPRFWQVTGSCVSHACRAYAHAMCGDIVHRGDNEKAEMPFPFATYGVGRDKGGMRRPGSGSYGSVQAWAVEHWGMLPIDHPAVPKPTNRSGWLQWTKNEELAWSHPSAWPTPKNQLDADAGKFKIQTIAKITSVQQLKSLFAQGFGASLASNFGTRPRIRGKYLVGAWNASWAHQMVASAYDDSPEAKQAGNGEGLIAIDNSWGPSAFEACPTLSSIGVRGSFWVTESTFSQIISRGEVFAHSNTMGFPAREIDWSDMGMGR